MRLNTPVVLLIKELQTEQPATNRLLILFHQREGNHTNAHADKDAEQNVIQPARYKLRHQTKNECDELGRQSNDNCGGNQIESGFARRSFRAATIRRLVLIVLIRLPLSNRVLVRRRSKSSPDLHVYISLRGSEVVLEGHKEGNGEPLYTLLFCRFPASIVACDINFQTVAFPAELCYTYAALPHCIR